MLEPICVLAVCCYLLIFCFQTAGIVHAQVGRIGSTDESGERLRQDADHESPPDLADNCSRLSPFAADQDCWHECPIDEPSTWTFFLGLEGSKQPQDFGINATFGGRFALNYGRLLLEEQGLGFQLGTSLNTTGNAVQVMERVEGTTGRTQSFTTAGVFQRSASGWKWGLGYDFLYQEYFDDFYLGQWRGRIGYDWTPRDEIGIQFSIHDHGDAGSFGAIPVYLRPLTQGAVAWRRQWDSEVRTSLWFGIAESHSETNAALGDLPDAGRQPVFGADLFAPLNDFLALYGEANLMMPADTGTVDAFLGVEFSPGGRIRQIRSSQSMPLLPVANNTSFSVNLVR